MWRLTVVLILYTAQAFHLPVRPAPFTAPAGAYGLLQFRAADGAARAPAAALDVILDGRTDQTVVLTPGVNRTSYEALLGPLTAGTHEVRLTPSTLWQWDASITIDGLSVEVVPATDPRAIYLAHAPAIGLRADTVGTASDLPLMMYVEDVRENAARWLKYSVIFSHEDGGTPGVALMARWGRTTDIELAYEVELQEGRAVRSRHQGPDHRLIAKSPVDVSTPHLLVSTLNNMFVDRGHAAVVTRMVPKAIDLTGRSRESVMDDHPWMYRVMARELATERPAGVGDPIDYLYVDLELKSRGAGVALGARSTDGTTWWSDRGRPDLVVSRQGELRIAVPAPAANQLHALAVRCDPRPDPNPLSEPAHCAVELRRTFRLTTDHQPGRSLTGPARLAIDAGTAREIAISVSKIER